MNFSATLKKRWPFIAILIIIILGIYVRTLDYNWHYLRNIDSYTFYRWMDEILINGGKLPVYDSLTYSPVGGYRGIELFPYHHLGAYSYTFMKLLFTNLQLWQWLIWFSPIVVSLAAIPMYYIGKILYDRKAGVMAAFFIVFEVSNISRSLGGDPDNDAIVILVPLIVMAVFLYSYKYIEKTKSFTPKFFAYSATVGALLGLWGHTWAGYWYLVWLLIGFLILKLVVDAARTRSIKSVARNHKHIVASYVIFFIFLAFTVVPFFGWQKLSAAVTGPIDFQSIKSEEGIQYPNVYVSVAELQGTGDPKEVILRTCQVCDQPYKMLLSPFFLMIYALIYLLYSYYKTGMHIDTVLLLLVWFLGPFLATIIAVRFSILFAAPMAIGSGILLAKILNILINKEGVEK
ncbi:MAG: hypothetical protein HY513_02790 [Candidatus Aenigmarchaeota archaeon]|nr:hypothetical protein [Candidatus Aenigmarchaeota archaeon]